MQILIYPRVSSRDMVKPRCCNKAMLTTSARLKREGDLRPTSKIPYRAVGWYCKECNNIKSLVVDIKKPSLLICQTIYENMELRLSVQHKVQD